MFGKSFIKNNINKCIIIYNNYEYDLCEYINYVDHNYKTNDIITIKLKGYNGSNPQSPLKIIVFII